LGVLLLLSGIVAAATREPRRSLIVNAPGIAAVITFIAAVVLLFGGAPGIAWAAGVLAILTVLVGATLRMGRRPT
jgi:glycerol-3-phosphate acyltransferase PlsY